MPTDIAAADCFFYTCLLTLLLRKDCSSSGDAHWHCCCMETVLPLQMLPDIAAGGCSFSTHAYWHDCCWRLFLYTCLLTFLLEAVLHLLYTYLTLLLQAFVFLSEPARLPVWWCEIVTVLRLYIHLLVHMFETVVAIAARVDTVWYCIAICLLKC